MSNDISVIYWKSKDIRPEEGSYILLKCIDESGQVVCEPAAYENGTFIYFYDKGIWGEANRFGCFSFLVLAKHYRYSNQWPNFGVECHISAPIS